MNAEDQVIELSRWRIEHRENGERREYRFLLQRNGMWVCTGKVDFEIDQPEWDMVRAFVKAFLDGK